MGMTIDEAIPVLHDMYNYYNDTDIDAYIGFEKEDNNAIETALDTMRKYQQLQADYNARLKADMVAMLEDLDLQIDELGSYNREVAKVQRLIRDRIDKLKETGDATDRC